MASCYSKNSILKGTVDFYCLVCETYLKSEADNIDHIAKPAHKKNLDNTQYVKDFEEDFIRKIKKRYFCELCNKLLPMMARVKIHVNERAHIDSKNVMFFKRNGVYVIAFGKVVLNDKAWNGLNEESCAFCNTEYEDEEIHKSLLSHILNIIQIKVEVDEKKNIYRKIDEVSFHCLTCNMVLALNNLTRHFEEDQHKHLYQECCAIPLNNTNKNELKEKECNNTVEDHSDKTNDHLIMPVNNTGEKTEQTHTTSGSELNKNVDVMKETTAIDARPLNEICEKEKEFKIATNSVVNKEFEDTKENSEDCVPNSSIKTAENKDVSKAVQDNDVDKKYINLADKKVKKKKTKINTPESNNNKKPEILNEINKTTRSQSGFNIEKYEKQICKMLKTEDYITLDENGKTLCILCDWIIDPKSKKIHSSGLHHQTIEKLHKRRLAEIGDKNSKNKIEGETRDKNNKENTVQNKSILDLVSKFQANNVNINLLFNTAVCKKCTINLPYDVDAIEEHILKHNKKSGKEENKGILQSCEAIDKETCENSSEVTIKENRNEGNVRNEIEEKLVTVEDRKENEPTSKRAPVKINKNEGNVRNENEEKLATVEDRNENQPTSKRVPKKIDRNEGNVRNENEEKLVTVEDRNENQSTSKQAPVKIDEKLMSNITSLKDETKGGIGEPSASINLQKQSLGSYIKIFTGVKHMIFNDVIINDIVCIAFTSFNYFLSIKGETKCMVCEEEVRDIEIHVSTLKHINLMNTLPVILNEKTEFVREMNPKLLHCGFCNMTVSSWSEMLDHFASSYHKESKDAAGWRMIMYDTEFKVENNHKTSNISDLSMRNMLSGLF